MTVGRGITRRGFLAGLAGAVVTGTRGAGDPLVRRSLVVPIATTPAKGGRGRWSVDFDVTLAPL